VQNSGATPQSNGAAQLNSAIERGAAATAAAARSAVNSNAVQRPGGYAGERYDVQNSGARPQGPGELNDEIQRQTGLISDAFQRLGGYVGERYDVQPGAIPSPLRQAAPPPVPISQLQDQLAAAQAQAAEANMRRRYREHEANVGEWVGDRLANEQIAAAQGGSQDYNIARGRGTPEQEAAFQASLAQQRGQQASQDFAASMPGGEQMNRFAQLQALRGLQSNVNPPQVEDTQANVAEYGKDRRYANRVMETGRIRRPPGAVDYVQGRPELALTDPGNVGREGGPISSQSQFDRRGRDVTGQVRHDGEMISARTADVYKDKAAANRRRINERRAARGGMSERQARDISRRLKNPSAVAAYAVRNGLENHPMVQSILGGGQGAVAAGGAAATPGSYPSTPTPTSAATASTRAAENYSNSEFLQNFGVESGGGWEGYSTAMEDLIFSDHNLTDENLTEIHAQIGHDSHGRQEFWEGGGSALFSLPTTRASRVLMDEFMRANTPKRRRQWFNNYRDRHTQEMNKTMQGSGHVMSALRNISNLFTGD
jgi:hypothetical protein